MRILFLMILAISTLTAKDLRFLGPPIYYFHAQVQETKFISKWLKEITFSYSKDIHLHLFPCAYIRVHVPPYRVNTSVWKPEIPEQFLEKWEQLALFNRTIDHKDIVDNETRPYTLVNYSEERHEFTLLVKIAKPVRAWGEWGVCSPYLFSLRPGDFAAISGTFGNYPIIPRKQPLVFLIGGCGIAPAKRMIDYLLLEHSSKAPIYLFYSASEVDEAVFHEYFLNLSIKYSNFDFHLYLTDEKDVEYDCSCMHAGSLLENLEEKLSQEVVRVRDAIYHICGPPKANEEILEVLKKLDVPQQQVILDS